MSEETTKKLTSMLSERDKQSTLPIWVRAPKAGQPEYYTQLGRGKMYQAERNGRVKTATLKQPGQTRGVKLFNLRSLLSYIEQHSTAGQ